MGLFIGQDEQRSELQSKIIADLQEKARQNSALEHKDVEPKYLEGQHQTRVAGVIIGALLIVLVAVIIVIASQR